MCTSTAASSSTSTSTSMILLARSSINIVDFVHVREDLVHVLEIVDVQDPVDDVPAVENEDFDDEVVGKERNSRTWTSSKRSSRTT